MHQDDINKDLNHYLHDKKKDVPIWDKVFNKHPRPKDEVVQEIKEDIEEKAQEAESQIAPEDKKELSSMEEKIVEAHEEEEYVDEKQEGLLKKFFKKLNFSDKKKEEFDDEPQQQEPAEEEPQDDDELREFLKMNHSWITQLDPETLKEFKNSKDFELYTKILKKHGLIK